MDIHCIFIHNESKTYLSSNRQTLQANMSSSWGWQSTFPSCTLQELPSVRQIILTFYLIRSYTVFQRIQPAIENHFMCQVWQSCHGLPTTDLSVPVTVVCAIKHRFSFHDLPTSGESVRVTVVCATLLPQLCAGSVSVVMFYGSSILDCDSESIIVYWK